MYADAGRVYIVGAGPGDPELMTLKARRVIDSADVVMHDSLVGTGILETLPDEAEVVGVGKNPNGERTTQDEINRRMVEEARDGNVVARLKCGDPNVFGRGGEETQHLASCGVEFEVVPGITSAIGVPGVEGIPTTHREHASSLTVVTGHEDPTKDESALDWNALAGNVDAGGTLVILMGVRRLPDNATALRENGVPADTPVAMVERGTLEDSRTVVSTLDGIVDEARAVGIEPPAVTVVGDVVGVRDDVSEYLVESGASKVVRDAEGDGEAKLEVVQGD
ncbi:MAG: uroporphyrinogen-III C-methyltransferase [Halobacteriales archaeon]|nr:uroporphyrinogen-III C-methyltransferase [Halobacteriales archaeon]